MKLVVVALVCWATASYADVQHYAVIVGADAGAADEQRLHYAETDAQRVADVLSDLGSVPEEKQVVLRGKTADRVRSALITTNERIRGDQRAGQTTMLFVYYSGHGDADALHLGDTRLDLRELEALVRGSPADVRVLVIDSCRSGSVTRVKGGTPAPPLALPDAAELPGEGMIVLTASTAGEDAQESDDLGGSFFTHYLVSALQGAADDDGDQIVTVSEAFSYTRDQTVLASSRTVAGTQHPTFAYDLRGRADVPLAELGARGRHGRLVLPGDGAWLISRVQPVSIVAEISTGSRHRTLTLRPGSYRVRGRTRDALLEGSVAISSDSTTTLDAATLDRVTYAQLVRKGHGEILSSVDGPIAGALVQSSIIAGASACVGAFAGWRIDRAQLSISPRLLACRGTFESSTLSARTDLLGGELRGGHAWDIGRLTLDLGITGGAELLREDFSTRGIAPARDSVAGELGASGELGVVLAGRIHLVLDLAGQTHILSIESQAGDRHIAARFVARGLIGVGIWR